MDIEGSEVINAPLELVWQGLNDPAVLRQCIPGCERLDRRSETDWDVAVAIGIGPIKARFEGEMHLSNIVPPRAYTISGEGKGGLAGFAKGSADVSLTAQPDGTTLMAYVLRGDVGGKIANIGGWIVRSTARKLGAQFFHTLAETVKRQAAQR